MDDWDSIPGRGRQGIFSLHYCVQVSSSAHPAFCPWIQWALSLVVKHLEYEVDQSPPSRAVVKIAWSYTSTLPYFFMVWCLIKHRIHLHGVVLG
jgi:hypothetical protein